MKLNVVEILKHLPKTNCKECGEATCMAFAAKLAKKEVELKACPPMFTGEYAAKREILENMLMGKAA